MVRPNVPTVSRPSRRPTTKANRSNATSQGSTTRTATTRTTTTKTNTTTRTTAPPERSTTTTAKPHDTTGTPQCHQNQLLMDLLPFFDEYQAYCVMGAGGHHHDPPDDDDDEDPHAQHHIDDDTTTSDQRQLRKRLVQRILSVCQTNNVISEMTHLTVIDEDLADDASHHQNEATTVVPPPRPTKITACFVHILQTAVAHLLPSRGRSSSTTASSASASTVASSSIRPSSIRASSAILDLLVSSVVAWAPQCTGGHKNYHQRDDVDLLLSRLQEYSQCQYDAVRILSVRALCHLAECLGRRPVTTMDDAMEQQRLDRLDTIQQALLPRFTDKAIAVRCAVVQACFTSAPNPRNPLCTDPDLLQAIQWIVQHDPSPNNRQMALQQVPVNRTTMEYVMPRIRDTKANVRLAAIAALSRAVDRSYPTDANAAAFLLPSRHMAEMITSGYTDRCLTTKEAIRRMVCTSWIPAAKCDPITLLQWLNVIDHPTVATTILQIWLDVSNVSPPWFQDDVSDCDQQRFRDGLQDSIAQFTISDLISSDHSPSVTEQLCIARNLLQLIPSEYEKDVLWSQLIPDIPMLCQVLETLSSKLVEIVASQMSPSQENDHDASANEDSMTFVCLELLQLASINTASMEEGSRRVMASTIKNLLSNVVTPDDLLEGCWTTLQKLLRSDDRDDDSGSIEIGMLPVMQHLSDIALSSENELLRVHTSIRIVSLITLTLENRDLTSEPANLEAMEFFWDYVRPLISHENRLLRQAAVRTMGLLGLGSTQHVMLPQEDFTAALFEISSNEMEDIEIRMQAMFALTDWVMLQFRNGHGIHTNDRVFDLLCGQVDQLLGVPAPFNQGTICCAAEIATKLILTFFMGPETGPNNNDDDARISTWVARLVLLYFDYENLDAMDLDDCDNEDVSQVGHPVRLQQLLSVFFPALTTTPAMRRSGTYFMESITPLLTMSMQLLHKKQKSTAVSLRWIRSIDFVVSSVSKSRQQPIQSEVSPTISSAETTPSAATLEETPAMEHDNVSESLAGDAISNEAKLEGIITESTPGLIASVKVASFLSEQGSMINTVIRRALCKWISNQSSCLEVENELWEDLTRFKEVLEELVDNDGIDDASCRRMLEPVLQSLRKNVESDTEEDEEEEDADDNDGAGASLSNDFEKVIIRTDENENSKSTVAVPSTAKHSSAEITSQVVSAGRRNERARRRLRPSN